jgi:MFS family permease
LIKVDPKRLLRRPRNIFFGWWIVTVSASADALKHGTFNRGFTLYVLPISRELGVGVAAISLAEMLGRMEGGLQGPLMGWLNDRFGPRAIMIFGGIASGVGFILLSATQSYVYFLLVFVGLLSLGFRAGYNNATMPAINQWFRRHRSLAMSVASMGSPLGGMVIAPLMGLLAFEAGWRTSAFVSGSVILAVVLPLSLFVHRSPESKGLLPDGDTPMEPEYSSPGAVPTGNSGAEARSAGSATVGRTAAGSATTGFMMGEPDFTVREAMRTSSYWLLVLAVGFRNTVHSGTSFLLAPLIVWFLMGGGRTEDTSLRIAALMVGLLSLSSLLMIPVMGWLGDTWSKQRLSAMAMIGGSSATLVLLNHSGNMWQVVLFVVLLAFSETANPLAWAMIGDFFGRRNYATLRGWQHLPDQLMSMSTPVWMGVVVDQTGSYKWALIPLAAIYVLAAVSYWIIPRPKPPVRAGPGK